MAHDRTLVGIDRLLVVTEATIDATRDGTEQRVDRREAAHAARLEIAGHVLPEAFGVAAGGVIERLAIRLVQRGALALVERLRIAEARADVREIGAGDDDRALVVDHLAHGIEEALDGARTARAVAVRLVLTEPGEDRDDARLPLAEQVAEE